MGYLFGIIMFLLVDSSCIISLALIIVWTSVTDNLKIIATLMRQYILYLLSITDMWLHLDIFRFLDSNTGSDLEQENSNSFSQDMKKKQYSEQNSSLKKGITTLFIMS